MRKNRGREGEGERGWKKIGDSFVEVKYGEVGGVE